MTIQEQFSGYSIETPKGDVMKDKLYFSSVSKLDSWDSTPDAGIAYLFAIPKRWWSIKEWKLVNGFLKTINGFYRETPKGDV